MFHLVDTKSILIHHLIPNTHMHICNINIILRLCSFKLLLHSGELYGSWIFWCTVINYGFSVVDLLFYLWLDQFEYMTNLCTNDMRYKINIIICDFRSIFSKLRNFTNFLTTLKTTLNTNRQKFDKSFSLWELMSTFECLRNLSLHKFWTNKLNALTLCIFIWEDIQV